MRNKPVLAKIIFWKYFKIKGILAQYIFLDFADVSSYSKFKVSAGKGGCTISFELKMPQNLLTTFLKSLAKLYKGNKNSNPIAITPNLHRSLILSMLDSMTK